MTSLRRSSRDLNYGCSKGPCEIWPRDIDLIWWPTFTHLPKRGSIQFKCPFTELCSFRRFFNFESLTKLSSFNINIVYAKRSLWPFTWHDLITPHTTWPQLWMFKGLMQNLTLWPWPDDPFFYNCLQKAAYSANMTPMHWNMLFLHIFQLWNPYKTAFIQY